VSGAGGRAGGERLLRVLHSERQFKLAATTVRRLMKKPQGPCVQQTSATSKSTPPLLLVRSLIVACVDTRANAPVAITVTHAIVMMSGSPARQS
jgi:hypothetical protein